MLRRAVIAPRHYLEHSVALPSCKPLILHFPFIQLRWGAVAATSPQYSPARYASRQDARAERNPESEKSPPSSSGSPLCIQSDSPEYLANAFIAFLEWHGQTTEMALQSLNSGSLMFSSIRRILENHRIISHVANVLAVSDYPASCIRLLSLSLAWGHRLNAPTYEGVCWTLSQHKQYLLVREVCRLAKDNLSMMTSRLLDWRLRADYELENFGVADTVLRDYEDAGVKPSRRTWHIILTATIRNRNLARARQCMKLMEQAGFPVDHTTHAVIAANYRHLGYDTQVQDFAISALGPLSPSNRTFVVNRLLQTHLLLDDDGLGFRQLLSFFENSAIGPLQTFTASGGDESLTVPLSDLKTPITISPDCHTFLIGARFCIAQSKFATAEEIFSFMGEQGFEASSAILVAFLELQFALGRPGFALSIASLLLTSHKHTCLRDQLQKCELEHGRRWPFAASCIDPTIDPFNVLMRGLVATLGLGAARPVLKLMKQAKVKPDSYTIKILIDHLIRSEKKSAPSVVLRMLRQLSPVLRPSLHHLHAIIAQLLRDERTRLYSSSPKLMHPEPSPSYHDDGHTLTDPAAGLRLERSLRRLRRLNLSHSLLQSLKDRGVRSDATMLRFRMRYEGIIRQDTSATIGVYNDMLARGMTPLVYHVAALMEAFTLRGETEKALEIMHSAKTKPNVAMYTILLQGYTFQGQPKAAAELFQSMVADGIQPDVRAICALCFAFVHTQQFGAARKLLLTLWPYVGPLPWGHAGLSLRALLNAFRSLDSPGRAIAVSNRDQLRKDITEIVKEYKHVAGLSAQYMSSSGRVKQLAKKSVHVNRRV